MYRIPKDKTIYAMSKMAAPVLEVEDSSTVVFETCDCFADQIQSEDVVFSQLDWERINPATGPVFVKGAEPGDILQVKIVDIKLADHGVMVTGPGLGSMGKIFTENEIKIIPIRDGQAVFDKDLCLPVKPMIGVIGTAPADEPVPCGTPGSHGGNMDCKKIGPGAALYLPVNVPGALFALGDLHAVMGDGEVAVCGVEISGEVTVELNVIKGKKLPLPLLVDNQHVITISSHVDLDTAAEECTKNMAELLVNEIGMTKHQAVKLMSLAGDLRVCQIVDPLRTARFEFPLWLVGKFGYKFKLGS